MSKGRKSVATALALTAISATAAWAIRRRNEGQRPHVGLYFEDGSMVSLPESSPQATELVELGTTAVTLVRGA